jgi:hypothetical protein
MARKKRLYTLDEQILNRYTFGSEWMYLDGTEYIGLYHKYTSTSEVYTGAEWNTKTSKILIPFANNSATSVVYRKLNDYKTAYKSPVKYFVTLTDSDIKRRSIKRYFLVKKNDLSVIEIDKKQFNEVGNTIDPTIYQKISITWFISGAIETTQSGRTKNLGVLEKNQQAIRIAIKNSPAMRDYLTNPLEFYLDTDLIIPPDIN